MRRVRYAIAIVIALSYTAAPGGGPFPTPPPADAELRPVASAGVEVLVPKDWRVRPLDSPDTHRRGLQAATDLTEFEARRIRAVGIEAYWVDATSVGVPSDYYYLAARGPAMSRFTGLGVCRATEERVVLDDRPSFERDGRSPGSFVAVSEGTCRSKRRGHRARWASFVAAPGFGPVGSIGIPGSGMYSAVVMVPDGPRAIEDIDRLLNSVRFGDTSVAEFIATAEAAGRPL